MTQVELAQAVRLTAVSVSNLERGRHFPSLSSACSLSQVLGIELVDLVHSAIDGDRP